MTALIEGHGGGKGSSAPRVAQEAPDSLRSRALVRALIVLGEGEIAGIPAGRTLEQCVKLNGVPVQNADETFNFSNVRLSLRTGTADQDHLPGFAAQETTVVKNAVVRQATPVDHVVTTPEVDAVRVIVGVNQLTEQDTTNGDLNGSAVRYRILVQEGAGAFVPAHDDTITGKTLGGYQRGTRIALPPGRPCTVRVERLTEDSDSAAVSNDLFFAAAVNVTDAKLGYPHLACLGLEVPADEVQGRTPEVAVELDWLLCWVPANYNPVTRSYAGIWNGSFKRAWTNNPAWCLYTLLRDELFGLGDRIAPEQIDKWAFYHIGQYCDGLVDDGAGGQEPRFVCNGPINRRESAQQWIATLCAAFRGAFAWTAGGFRPVADMPADPVAVFTNANVVGGAFEYQGVPLSARASAAAISIRDPSDQYRLKALAGWEEPDLIERFGWRQRDASMPFETRLSGGIRAAKWLVESDGRTGETVTFAAGGDGYALTVFDPILISDRHRVNLRTGGRLLAVGSNSVTLDAPVAFSGAATYTITTHSDAAELVEMAVTPGTSGSLSVVPLAGPVPAGVQPGHAWILTASTLSARRYRVLGAAENGATVQVVAIEEDPGKWARIENGITLVQPPPFILPPGGAIPAPGPVSIAEFARPRVGASPESWITVSWPTQDDPRIDRWRVEVRPPGAGWQLVGEVRQPTVDIPLSSGLDGTYGVRVRALALTGGNESAWTTVEHVPTGLVIPLAPPTGVAIAPLIGGFRVTADQHPAPSFRRLMAYVGTPFDAAALKGSGEPGGFDVTGLTPGETITVWVTADGWRQPESAPVGPFAVTPRQLQASDFDEAIIDAGNFTEEVRDRLDRIDVSAILGAPGGVAGRLPAIIAAQDAALADTRARLDAAQSALSDVALRLSEVDWRFDGALRDASFEVDPATGVVRIAALDRLRDDTTARFSEVEGTFDAVNAAITLRATQAELNAVAEEILESLTPAARWQWLGTAEGWAGVDATATPGDTALSVETTTGGYVEITGLSIDGDVNPQALLRLRRTAGDAWGVALAWDAGSGWQDVSLTEPNDPALWNTARIAPGWSGTITGLRILLGDASTFELDYLEIGKRGADAQAFDDLQARIANAEIAISAAEAAITLKADQATLDAEGARITSAEARIDAAEAAITLKADETTVDALETRVGSAEITLSATEGVVTDIRSAARDAQGPDAALEAGVAAWLEAERRREAVALARQELTTQTQAGLIAEAASREALRTELRGFSSALVFNESLARSTAISAEALQRTALGTRLDGDIAAVNASLTLDYYTISEVDAAISASALALQAEIDGAVGDIETTLATKVDAAGVLSVINAQVSAASGGGLATVGDLTSAQTTLEGDARALRYLTVAANGSTATQLMGASDNGSVIAFSATRFEVANGTGGRVKPFVVVGDTVFLDKARIRNADIDTLKLDGNAVTIPLFVQASVNITGTGSLVTILTGTIVLDQPGFIMAMATVQQGFTIFADQLWQLRLNIGGVNVGQTIGTVPGDSLAISGARTLGAGTHTVELRWNATSGIRVQDRSLLIMGVKR